MFEFEEDTVPATTDLSCEVCGSPLSYVGRGRKPRFCDEHKPNKNAQPKKGSAKVEAAMSVLGFYDGIAATVLMGVSPNAAALWVSRINDAESNKRMILEGNPALANKIASVGQRGGAYALVGAYAMAGFPAVALASAEVAQRRNAKKEATL